MIEEKKHKLKKLFYSKKDKRQLSDFHLSKRVIEKFFNVYKKALFKKYTFLSEQKRTKNVRILTSIFDHLDLNEIAIISLTTAINFTADKGYKGVKYNNLCQTISARLDKEIKFKQLKKDKMAFKDYNDELKFYGDTDSFAVIDIISTKIINKHNIKSGFNEESKAVIGSFLLHILINSTGAIKIRKEKRSKSKSTNLKVCYLNQLIIDEILKLIEITFSEYNVNCNNNYIMYKKPFIYKDSSFIKSNKEIVKNHPTPKPYLNAVNKLNSIEYSINDNLFNRILELRDQFPLSSVFIQLKDLDTDVYRSGKFLDYVKTEKYETVKKNKYDAKKIKLRTFQKQDVYTKKLFLKLYREEKKEKAIKLFDGAKEYYEALEKNKDYHIEYKKYARSKIAAIKHNSKNKQKLFSEIHTLNKCSKLLNESFYFIHETDFRGRVYTKNKKLSYQNNDLQRSLICYKDKKEITKDNIDNLLIYMANCYGIKGTFKHRIEWTIKHKKQILRTGGINVKKLKEEDIEFMEMAKEPFQFISCCIEYYNYINSKFYYTPIIIYSDGSCNAIQHTALITNDENLKLKTNLKNVDECFDFYSDFLDYLLKNLPKRYNHLKRYITRSLIKKPVMTYIYGANRYSISDRVVDDIIEKLEIINYNFKDVFNLSKFITDTFFIFINKYHPIITELKTELSKKVKENDYEFNYVNDQGFLIVNDYQKKNIKEIKYNLDNEKIRVYYNKNETHKIDKRKSLNSFNANYIHSKDAEHLIRIVNNFNSDITTIHDSFGTSIDKVSELNKIIREQLYLMYNKIDKDILVSPYSFT